jgi:hypothetical protein
MLRAVGATETLTTSARAVATQVIVTCDIRPLMLCKPGKPLEPGDSFPIKPLGFAPGQFSLALPPRYAHDDVSEQKYCYGNSVYSQLDDAKVDEVTNGTEPISILIVDCPKWGIEGDQTNTLWDTQYADFHITGLPGARQAQFIEFKKVGPARETIPKRIVQLVR